MKRLLLLLPFLLVAGCAAKPRAAAEAEAPAKTEAVSSTWANWRGPEMNGVSRETGLPDKAVARKGGENFVFAVPYSGLSSPVVLNGKVYVVGRVGKQQTQQECVQAFDAVTGKLLWQDKVNVWLSDIVDSRLGFTSVAGDLETGNVYAHTTAGEFIAYSGDGKILWKHSPHRGVRTGERLRRARHQPARR